MHAKNVDEIYTWSQYFKMFLKEYFSLNSKQKFSLDHNYNFSIRGSSAMLSRNLGLN